MACTRCGEGSGEERGLCEGCQQISERLPVHLRDAWANGMWPSAVYVNESSEQEQGITLYGHEVTAVVGDKVIVLFQHCVESSRAMATMRANGSWASCIAWAKWIVSPRQPKRAEKRESAENLMLICRPGYVEDAKASA